MLRQAVRSDFPIGFPFGKARVADQNADFAVQYVSKSPFDPKSSAAIDSYDAAKRAIDITGSVLLLTLLFPLLICVAIAVKLTSPGPVIFVQKRMTRGGRVFSMLKFRTMTDQAEAGTGPVWTDVDDPRVTSIGKVLRLARIDELPQLVNVVIGDMSLIGPRPERPEMAQELAATLPNFNRRMSVKGGITGLAQVSSGYAACSASYAQKLALDLNYIDNRSLSLDLQIAVRTIRVMATGSGAR